MAGYHHLEKKPLTKDQIKRLERVAAIEEEAMQAREETARKRLELEKEKQSLLDRKIKGYRELSPAAQLLEQLKLAYPQPDGVGMRRLKEIMHEEDLWKAERLAQDSVGGSYGIAA